MTRIKPFLKTVLVFLMLLFVHTAYGSINSKLLTAAEAGNAAKVERLLEKAVDVNAGAKDGVTSLMVAESKYHTEIVKILKQAGAREVAAEAEMGEDKLEIGVIYGNAYERETDQQPSETESQAIVYFYRNKVFAGKGIKPTVYCDEVQLAKIANGRYFIAKLDPGPHVFRSTRKKSVIEMNLVAGQTYYIQAVMEPGFPARGNLSLRDRIEAADAMGTLELLQAKFILEPEVLVDPDDPSLGEVKVGSLVPGESLGSAVLQGDTEKQILSVDQAQFPGCDTRRIVNTEVKEVSEDAQYVRGRRVAGNWMERWYMDRCGEIIPYEVSYVPDGKGGTFIHTEIAEASEAVEVQRK